MAGPKTLTLSLPTDSFKSCVSYSFLNTLLRVLYRGIISRPHSAAIPVPIPSYRRPLPLPLPLPTIPVPPRPPLPVSPLPVSFSRSIPVVPVAVPVVRICGR
uniref:Uncharacterized protein n=1 Tax=Polytomella parva TaxID=51329 RepID=A0A7S0VGJ4_9CHLO